ncbi:MAG: alpha-amylase [Anaerolineales bacterium]|nr:alpha-amylase [Anaerolineales bacterium]
MKKFLASPFLFCSFFLISLLTACNASPAPSPTPLAASPTAAPTETPLPLPTPTPFVSSLPWWNQTVWYEVFVRSFADSTTGPLACDGDGDLQGLIENLDYLNDGDPTTHDDLGVTGIWLMPIMASPTYHGYDITDYYTVNPNYGTNEDFQRLIEEAHKRGIKVIIDLVLNHTSNQHPWFRESTKPNSEYRDWYVWSEGKNPGYAGPLGVAWHPFLDDYYYGVFWSGMPDLNYTNPEVTTEIQNVIRFWLEEMGADGYRLDAIKYLVEEGEKQESTESTHAWLRDFYTYYKSVNPDAFTVGEVWSASVAVVKYLGDQLDSAFQFDLANSMLDAANLGKRIQVDGQMTQTLRMYPPNSYATFLTNHDQARVLSVLGTEGEARTAAMMLLTHPGIPFIYYGEEIGMSGTGPDENKRTPMQWSAEDFAGFSTCFPWQPANDDYKTINVAAQDADPNSLLNLYRNLIALRNEHPALMVGDYVKVETDTQPIYTFIRQVPGETILVVINLSREAVSDYAITLESSSLIGEVQAIDLLNGTEIAAPVLNEAGGFTAYKPLEEIPARMGLIIHLVP